MTITTVCDFNPWDEPATYALLVLTGMLVWTLAIWIERCWTFLSITPGTARAEWEQGLTVLSSIAATATFVGCLGATFKLMELLALLPHARDPAWFANELAASLVPAGYGLLVATLASASLSNLSRRIDEIEASDI